MSFKLPELGYDYSALEPFIDAKTMEIHHSKHHAAYVTNLNNALEGAGIKDYEAGDLRTLYGLLMSLDKLPENIRTAVRNNGGGHANHSMFWDLLKKPADGKTAEPSPLMKGELEKAFGSYEKFVEQFKQAGMTRFGSGWAWLVIDGKTNKLVIVSQPNQDNPVMEGHKPIMGVDVWEHAYYLKHQNVRANWLNDFFSVLNWEQVEKNYNMAQGK